MFKNSFYSSQSLNNISSVIVQVPQLPIMSLVCPPKWILLQNLVLLKICSDSPPFVICKGVPIFLKQSIDTRNSTIPRVLKVKVEHVSSNYLLVHKHTANCKVTTSRLEITIYRGHLLPNPLGLIAYSVLALPASSMHIQPKHAENQ